MFLFRPSCSSVRSLGSGAHVPLPTPPAAPAGRGKAALPPVQPQGLYKRNRRDSPGRRAETRGEEGRGGGGMLRGEPRHPAGGAPGPEAAAAVSRRGSSEARGKPPRMWGAVQGALRGRKDGQTRDRPLLPASPHTLMRERQLHVRSLKGGGRRGAGCVRGPGVPGTRYWQKSAF